MTASYEKRESILEKAPRRWRIEPDALVQEHPGGWTLRLPWSQVRQVRLRFAPTQWKTWRYLFTVSGPQGKIEFDNGHYVGVGDFENRSAAFSAFARAVLDEVGAKAPAARLYMGSSPLNYVLLAAPVVVAFAFLAFILLTLPVGIDAGEWAVAGKMLFLAAMLPVGLLWAVKAWPRKGTFELLVENLPAAPDVEARA